MNKMQFWKKSRAGSKLAGVGAVVGLGAVATSASAFVIDVTSITTLLTDVGVAVATIGLAVLAVVYGAKAYKWIRSAG
ncbi:MAG: major capsid protein [Rhodanobacter sp.]